MLPQVVYCGPDRPIVADIGGGAYSRRIFDDEAIGK